MKQSILLFASILFLSSCAALKKKTCTEVQLTTDQIEMVQANPGNSMYVFIVSGGELDSAKIHINIMNEGEEKDAFIMKMGATELSTSVNKDSWTWKEDMEPKTMSVKAKGNIQIQYGKTVYCFDVSYEGPMMKMPGMPAPPDPNEMPQEEPSEDPGH